MWHLKSVLPEQHRLARILWVLTVLAFCVLLTVDRLNHLRQHTPTEEYATGANR